MKFRNILTHNIGLKLLALILAFLTLIYVGETEKSDQDKTVLQKLFVRTDYVSKRLEVVPIFAGKAPGGYELLKSAVRVSPESVLVIGPAEFLSDKEAIFTEPIDLSEHTKPKIVSVKLEAISRAIKSQEAKVQVHLAVEKTVRNGKGRN